MTTPTPVPILRYSFDTWTSGNTVPNEGSLGTSSTYNATLCTTGTGGSASIISSSYATGTQCLSLVGNSLIGGGYLQLPLFTMGGSSWALCFWINVGSITVDTTVVLLTIQNVNENILQRLHITNGKVYYSQIVPGQARMIYSDTIITDNKWHHILVMYNSLVNTLFLYIDGVFTDSSSSFLQVPSVLRTTNSFGYLSTAVLPYSYGTMYIDDIRIYDNVLLSSMDIIDLNYLLIRYSFDTYTSGTSVQNEGILGSNYNGTIFYGSTIITTDSATGSQCLSCPTDSLLVVQSSFQFGASHWALAFWFKAPANYISNIGLLVLDGGSITLGIVTWPFMNLTMHDHNGNYIGPVLINKSTQLSAFDNTWRHMTLLYNNTTHLYYVYFNGVEMLSFTGVNYVSQLITELAFFGGSPYILFDDIRVYNNVLLGINDIAYICGNNKYYTRHSPVLLNTLFDAYQISSTKSIRTGYNTKIGNTFVDLNCLYAPYTSGTYNLTGIIGCVSNAPNLITGCIHYVSADQGVVSSNGIVSQWTDLSGNNCNLTQSITAAKPTYQLQNSVMNNNSSVLFNYQCMNCSTYLTNTTTYNVTICMVGYVYSDTTQSRTAFDFNGDSGIGLRMVIPMNCTDNIMSLNLYQGYGINFPTAYVLLKQGVPFILVITLSSTSTTVTMNVYVNGSLVTGTPTSYPFITQQLSVTNYYIGLDFYLGCNVGFINKFKGAYSSFALYNTVLSTTQRQQLEGYLAWKWWGSGSAILSDPNHPYYSTQGCDIGTLFNPISVV